MEFAVQIGVGVLAAGLIIVIGQYVLATTNEKKTTAAERLSAEWAGVDA